MTKELRRIPLADIKPYENNPRKNDQAVEAVAESIRQCEYIAPIIVDETGVVLAGHTRLKALESLGKTEADVLIVNGLTDAQKRKYRLLDNKTNELAGWDFDLLADEIEGLDFEGFDFGFDVDVLDVQDEQEGPDETYTTKTDIPQYEPPGNSPCIEELYNSNKTTELINEIESADIEEEVKDFLIMAAHRHTVFNYKKIADYYANADAETQDLMERSALVIIDFDNAVANGFVVLDKSIREMIREG